MPAVSGNPAYELVPQHKEQPLQVDDQMYSNIDQQEAFKYSENPKHGTALIAEASPKWQPFFLLQCHQVSYFFEWQWINV